ncbi:hypothetical protein, partial [Staphylococcus nepalensis]|uniref:hypothetical protein n=1 Tax=Staphylococcus nepalensis TaxID=214473 RepID=UPI00285FFC16
HDTSVRPVYPCLLSIGLVMTLNSIFPHWPKSPAGYHLCLYKYKTGKGGNYYVINVTLIAAKHLKAK